MPAMRTCFRLFPLLLLVVVVAPSCSSSLGFFRGDGDDSLATGS